MMHGSRLRKEIVDLRQQGIEREQTVTRALAGDCDVIVKGTLDGLQRGLLLEPLSTTWIAERSDLGPWTTQEMRQLVADRRAVWTFTAVPPGSGSRTP